MLKLHFNLKLVSSTMDGCIDPGFRVPGALGGLNLMSPPGQLPPGQKYIMLHRLNATYLRSIRYNLNFTY